MGVNKKIAIIGAGNLGISLAEGILDREIFRAQDIYLTRNQLSKIQYLGEKGIQITSDNSQAAAADVLILAVKPFKVLEILAEIKPHLNSSKLIISVATGISIQAIQEKVGDEIPIFRAMPNTAASVSESLTCIAGNSTQGLAEVERIFQSIGETVFIQEELMNAATVLGACGIAYVLRFIRAMIQGGIEIGFDSTTATQIVTQTVKGAAELLIQKGLHPEQEIDKVTTPKGCTIVGLNEMEHQGFSSALIKGIKTSFEKI